VIDIQGLTDAELGDTQDPSTYQTCVFWLCSDKVFASADTPQKVLRDATEALQTEGFEFQKNFHKSAQIKNTWYDHSSFLMFSLDSSGVPS
jgi:hypothetical protein